MFDILILNGQVIDGSKTPGFRADVAIQGDRIAHVGKIAGAEAGRVVNAAGKTVAPGFIDIHSHGDMTLPACPTADSSIYQGVTTAVIGQCGLSPAPLFAKTRAEVISSLEPRKMPIPWERWSDFKSYLAFLKELGLSVNIVPLVGQGTIRGGVMGFGSGRATPAEMDAMQIETIRAMNAGAVGLSTGLVYPPGSYAPTEELIELTRVVGQRQGRGPGRVQVHEARNQIQRVSRLTHAGVPIEHLAARSWRALLERRRRLPEIHRDRLGLLVQPIDDEAGDGLVAAVAVEQEEAAEAVADEAARGLEVHLLDELGRQRDCAGEFHVVRRVARQENRCDQHVGLLRDEQGALEPVQVVGALR